MRTLVRDLAVLGLFVSWHAPAAHARSLIRSGDSSAVLVGHARAADGDSLVLQGRRIRLFGIDAPELSQTCRRAGQNWACGETAKQKLEALVSNREIICKPRSIDAFGRQVASCSVTARDIGEDMVRAGLATAFRQYSNDYVSTEEQARSARLGIWAGEFQAPADYRHEDERATGSLPTVVRPQRTSRSAMAPVITGSCRIKGNHSHRGEWIYHLPGMPYYEGTRAEAMFCTEAEARAAGYRRSRAGLHR